MEVPPPFLFLFLLSVGRKPDLCPPFFSATSLSLFCGGNKFVRNLFQEKGPPPQKEKSPAGKPVPPPFRTTSFLTKEGRGKTLENTRDISPQGNCSPPLPFKKDASQRFLSPPPRNYTPFSPFSGVLKGSRYYGLLVKICPPPPRLSSFPFSDRCWLPLSPHI